MAKISKKSIEYMLQNNYLKFCLIGLIILLNPNDLSPEFIMGCIIGLLFPSQDYIQPIIEKVLIKKG